MFVRRNWFVPSQFLRPIVSESRFILGLPQRGLPIGSACHSLRQPSQPFNVTVFRHYAVFNTEQVDTLPDRSTLPPPSHSGKPTVWRSGCSKTGRLSRDMSSPESGPILGH